MQLYTKRRFHLVLDEDDVEEFLDDATNVQARVRAEFYKRTDTADTSPTPAPRAP